MTVIEAQDSEGRQEELPPQGQPLDNQLDEGRGKQWEFYERGGWKPCKQFINDFLEQQIMLGVESCGMNIDTDGMEKYEWNFPDLIQTRHIWMKRGDGGQWNTVKTRSIRRVKILAGPEQPQG